MRDSLLIGFVSFCALIAIGRPVFGLLAFVFLGYFSPHSMTWTVGRTFRLSQLVAIGTIIGFLFGSEPKRFPMQRESFLLLALWGMFVVSTFFALYPDNAQGRLIHISKILLIVFLSMFLINTEHRLHQLLRVIALSIGFYGLKGGIFALLTGGTGRMVGPEGSFISSNNSIGLALAMNIPILFYLVSIERRRWFCWLMRGMLLFSFPAIVITYSRGAWLGTVAVVAMSFFKSRRKFRVIFVTAVFGFVVLPFLVQALPQRLTDRYSALVNYEEDESAQSRFWNWEFCTRVGLGRPLTGGGFDFYSTESYQRYFPEFLERYPTKVWSCHSMWFTIFGEHGFPGLAIWLGLIGSTFLSLMQIRSYGMAHPSMSWVSDCADMLQMVLVAFMVVGTFLDAAYFDLFYYLVAMLIIIKERIRFGEMGRVNPPRSEQSDIRI